MSASRQITNQPVEDGAYRALQRVEGRNHWCRLPLAEVGKQYHRGKYNVMLELQCEVLGQRNFIVCGVELSDCIQLGTPHVESAHGEREFSMLGFYVEIMNEPEGIAERVRSVIRLYPPNEIPNLVACKSLYFSLKNGRTIFVEGKTEDREINVRCLGRVISPLGLDKEPCHVIQGGSKVMENFPGEDGEPERDAKLLKTLRSLYDHLKIFITEEWVLVFLEEPVDLGLKINDVLVGPL